MSKDELSFANTGMNFFAQESVQIELLKIFKKFLERSLKFLQQQSQTVQKITPSGLKTKKDQSLSIITKNKKFTEDMEQMK